MALVPITFVFADGISRIIDVPAGERILDAAQAAGYQLLADCCEGNCGTCMAETLTGDVDLDSYDPMTLVPEDREAGVILPCVSRAREPATIEFPYDFAEVAQEEEQPLVGRITALTPVAAEVIRLAVELPEAVDFQPGQYVHIGPPGGEYSRSFSMANAPGERELVFYLRVLEDGRLSQWLANQARVGDQLEISAPRGAFFLRPESRRRVFVAGGTGLAPFLSMLAVLNRGADDAIATDILVGARTAEHLFGLEELQALAGSSGARVHVAVEEPDGRYTTGRVTDLLAELGIDAGTRVYLCGPPPMVEAARKAVQQVGIARRDVLCERFT